VVAVGAEIVKDLFITCLLLSAWTMVSAAAEAQVSDAALNDAPEGVSRMDQASSAPIVIGHRGASGYLPEHTTESAVMAHMMECDYIEQDCVISRDGVPIVMHDITLDDLTDVAKVFPDRKQADGHWYVFDFTVTELRQLRLTERRSPGRAWKDKGTRFPLELGSFRISTLAEHLQLIQGLNQSRARTAGVYVEVKEPKKHRTAGLDASTQILKVLAEYGYDAADDAIFLQCFDKDEVIRIRNELKSPLPLIYLLGKAPTADDIKDAAGFCDGLGVLYTLVVSGADGEQPVITDLVETAHQHGLQVHVWTFRTDALPAFAKSGDQLLEWLAVGAGVDGIFADQPDVVVKWRSQRMAQVTQGNPFRLLNNRPPK
jgi:glycerophosphoryl diester phosphodiesterase